MSTVRKTCLGVALTLSMVAMSDRANAAGACLDAGDLPAATQRELRAEIANARAATPELFKAVADIVSRARELDAGARKPGVPLTMHFKPLGPRALFPLLEALVFDARAAKDLPPSAASALRLGLIESVGTIGDPRAIPVLAKIMEVGRDNPTVRVSAQGLARIGTDEALHVLTTAATKARTHDAGNDRERAILSGMYDARRESAARFLARRLQQSPDAETARVIVKSLGGTGNAWAWRTLADQREASATRGVAANALVDAYVRFRGEVREQAAKALLVVDDASTPTLIAQAKTRASRDDVLALEALERRFADNPTR